MIQDSINNSGYRIGNFTSSEIWKLTTLNKKGDDFGKPALTYIEETNLKRLLGRSLNADMNSKPTSWGNLLEPRVFDLLGLEYTYSSQVTDVHPTIPFWAGSKDGTKEVENRAVIDIKCSYTLKSFCSLVMPLYKGKTRIEAMQDIRENTDSGEAYYWQLVSNAIINNCNHAELIIYMPYQSELLEITNMAKGNPSVKWMDYIGEDEIPYLLDGGYFKNLNKISFEVPQSDKDFLTSQVEKAGKMLVERFNLTTK